MIPAVREALLRDKIQEDEEQLKAMIEEAEKLASTRTDGHLSIFRFTTGWKVALGTPILEPGWPDDDYLWGIPAHPTLAAALLDFLERRHKFPTESDY